MSAWGTLNDRIIHCRLCTRLRDHCRRISREKRAAFADWDYWGQPVPNFGDPRARLLIVGLAPAAHGANRTGRMFTGDRSGEWLYRALYHAGYANQPLSSHQDDGMEMVDCAITAACHCAPPGNRPARDELAHCQQWLEMTVSLLPVKVFLALGQIAWNAVVDQARRLDWYHGARPRFGHGCAVPLNGHRWLLGSYHPSQQNTFTRRLTERMLDDVLRMAKELIGQCPERERTKGANAERPRQNVGDGEIP
jgi:uracil-DNA glycosylase family 4